MSGTPKPGQRATPAGTPGGMQLFDRDGSRKYLTVAERARFLGSFAGGGEILR